MAHPLPTGDVAPAAGGSRYGGLEQFLAIVCADSPNPRDPASYRAEAAFGYARSGAFGPNAAWGDEACASWPATDADGYFGLWGHWTRSPIRPGRCATRTGSRPARHGPPDATAAGRCCSNTAKS
jgi:hypothetical protein